MDESSCSEAEGFAAFLADMESDYESEGDDADSEGSSDIYNIEFGAVCVEISRIKGSDPGGSFGGAKTYSGRDPDRSSGVSVYTSVPTMDMVCTLEVS